MISDREFIPKGDPTMLKRAIARSTSPKEPPMTSKLDPQELERLSKAATQGVWRYRPDQYDDWGIVKSPVATDGFACVLAQFRDPDALDNETLARHREAKTDPWEANARFVCALVNAYRTGQLVPAMPSGDVVEAVKAGLRHCLDSERPGEDEDKALALLATAAITTYEAVSGVARKFSLGDRVTKTKGSSWTGLVVGFYSTRLTPIGYAVESENEPGSVQIYPESALAALGEKP